MSIYKASKTAAQILISSTSITLVILDRYYYSSAIESSLPLIREG
jgi:thymidylate kinase